MKKTLKAIAKKIIPDEIIEKIIVVAAKAALLKTMIKKRDYSKISYISALDHCIEIFQKNGDSKMYEESLLLWRSVLNTKIFIFTKSFIFNMNIVESYEDYKRGLKIILKCGITIYLSEKSKKEFKLVIIYYPLIKHIKS